MVENLKVFFSASVLSDALALTWLTSLRCKLMTSVSEALKHAL